MMFYWQIIVGIVLMAVAAGTFIYAIPILRQTHRWHATFLWALATGWAVLGAARIFEALGFPSEAILYLIGDSLVGVGAAMLVGFAVLLSKRGYG